jgi:hypothetical protein
MIANSQQAPKARVFISYSRKDMAVADRLEAALKERGFEPLTDRSEIYAFEDWWKRIEALIAQSDTVLCVLSPDSVSSDVCRKEISFAASLKKRFAPVVSRRVDTQTVPKAIAKLNYILLDNEDRFDESITHLAEALDTDIEWIRKETQFGQQARCWDQGGKRADLLLRGDDLTLAEQWLDGKQPRDLQPTALEKAFISNPSCGSVGFAHAQPTG